MAAPVSQTKVSFVIPAPEQNDPADVATSLAAAHGDYERGEAREALRHLRRAAESANEAGSDLRALTLARAAADLATALGGSLPPPAATVTAIDVAVVVDAPAVPSVAPSPAPPAARPALSGADEAALRQLLDSGRAMRVLVKRSARDEGLYVLRRADQNAPAFGTREAIVILLEPDPGFFE